MINLWPLFIGLALIGLAVGVQNSLLGIRAEIEGFDDYLIALLMSCYFAGFMIGSRLTPALIERVGHIRIFAALSAVASVTILIHALYVDPWAWALMRLLTGFAFSTIYVVAESCSIKLRPTPTADRYWRFTLPFCCPVFAPGSLCLTWPAPQASSYLS